MKHTCFLILILLSTSCGGSSDDGCPSATCADYQTQGAAQAAFDGDPECNDGLDDDHDGIACEHLPASSGGGGTGCPTTANCGCSGKTKSQCASTCCAWVIGQGCKCK